MRTILSLAAITALATALGGTLALRTRDRQHLILGLAAGLLLGLVAFDLVPEIFQANQSSFAGLPTVSILLVLGFLILHITERWFGTHEPDDSDYAHHESHSHVSGTLGGLAMGIHVFLDGIALAVAFNVSSALGIAVFAALVVHAFSDGLNTVSFLVKSKNWSSRAIWLLGLDAVARVSGALIGNHYIISESAIALYLALFAGFIIYIATSHILPEAHAQHPTRWTLVATIIGVIAMGAVVSLVG